MNKSSESVILSVALCLSGIVSSCTEYDFGFADEMLLVQKESSYTTNFTSRFGTIDPHQNWGFTAMEVVNFNEPLTRAGAGTGAGNVDVSRNLWTELSNTDPSLYSDGALARLVQIPGWPNYDGYYYTVNSGGAYNGIYPERPTDNNTYQAAGDVTDYEVQYVSEWFRSNPNPVSEELHLSDFFIQNISADRDRVSYPNGARMDLILNKACDFKLDYLVFKTMDSNDEVDDTWTHMNNYNSEQTNQISETVYYTQGEIDYAKAIVEDENYEEGTYPYLEELAKKTTSYVKTYGANDPNYSSVSGLYTNDLTHRREIKYVTSSGTEDFACRASFTDDSPWNYNWVLVHLRWNEVGKDGVEHEREGYYLAFDYYTTKDGQTYGPDGYYSNWIVKITPAHDSNEPNTPRRRVFCEDLGNTYDFDFNDVVFDVYYQSYYDANGRLNIDAVVTVQASGGTLPLYIGVDPSARRADISDYEAHKLLGQNTSEVPVNAIRGGISHEVSIYRIAMDPGSSKTYTADDIAIYVDYGKTGIEGASGVIQLRPALDDPDAESKKVRAPQKLCVPTTTRWMHELKGIESGYPYFDSFVSAPDTYGEGKDNSWLLNTDTTDMY